MPIVYLNGEFLEESKAQVSVLDRGFIFGDGVYEVIPVYGGHPFRITEHLDRLVNNLSATRIPDPYQRANWIELINQLIQKNDGVDQSIYLQITRGVAKRDHAIPEKVTPCVFMMSNPLIAQSTDNLTHGIAAITCEDNRWANCHIKMISLLANVLLRQQAIDVGADEAILIRDGEVTEGAASNVFIVKDDVMITPAKGPRLLPGITRDLILELAQSHNLPRKEGQISQAELQDADEVWLTSSTKEVIAVTTLNDKPIGNGQPGPMWKKIYEHYQSYKQQLRGSGE